MENTEERIAMLNRIPSPAFFVRGGIIADLNEAARQRQLCAGAPIAPLLTTGNEEYALYQSGSLYLTMNIADVDSSVCITRAGDSHLFVLEQDEDLAELQSMALAAKALRAPLSNVMTVADQLFPLTCFDNDPKAQEQIARINKGLYQMLRIVCNMSDAYRYTTEQVPRTEVRDIVGLLEEQFAQSAALIETGNIRLCYTGPREAIFGIVDAEKMERAVGNILSNAVKFTPVNGQIHASLTRRGKMLYLTVQDSGPGLPDHLRSNVYSSYRRQPGLEDSRFGIGLGMVLVRQTAALHGGTVLMEQGENFGLRLTMTIAIRQPSDANVRGPMIHVDYAGERDHRLLELADCLPAELYKKEKIN